MKKIWWFVVAVLLVALVAAVGYALFSSGIVGDARPTARPRQTAGAGVTSPTEPPADSTETIIILHTNDFHGAVEPAEGRGSAGESGGLVNLVSLIDQTRAQDPEHTILLDAGDTFQGTYVSNSTHGKVVMAAMNVAGYDAWALGNHEYDWGQEALNELIAAADFPALAANLVDTGTGGLLENVLPYTIVPAGQARVGIIGLTYPDTPTINRPENVEGLEFRGAVESVHDYITKVRDQADLIVVLSHLGYDEDKTLAEAVDGIDVIVGGHTHLFLERPGKVNGALIVQAGAKGAVLGRLELSVDLATGEVVEYASGDVLLPVSNDVTTINKEVQALVQTALAEAAETIDQPIGEIVRSVEPRRAGEFALGNLVVDAMLAADMGDGMPADIAMHNNGGIRASLEKGPITFGQLYAVLPFDNQLMALDLTGAQVLQILEHSVSERPAAMQVAGMTFAFSTARPVGERVLEVTVGGEPLDPERVYRLVTIDYLASGGDGQVTFLEGSNPAYGDSEVWAVAQYIREHSPVDPQIERRIRGQ